MVIHFVSGPIHSGKTTRLTNWCRQRNDVGGLLTPLLYEKRYFLDIFSNEWRPMEAEIYEQAVQQIGRFTFSGAAFDWANQALLRSTENPEINWLVLDEIGPLELRGQGLNLALHLILNEIRPPIQVVLVVRQHLVTAVSEHYGLGRFPVFHMHYPEQARTREPVF